MEPALGRRHRSAPRAAGAPRPRPGAGPAGIRRLWSGPVGRLIPPTLERYQPPGWSGTEEGRAGPSPDTDSARRGEGPGEGRRPAAPKASRGPPRTYQSSVNRSAPSSSGIARSCSAVKRKLFTNRAYWSSVIGPGRFLWIGLHEPDEALLRAATSGTLTTPPVLDRQVRRMLADPRSDALA
ncbi:DUF1592 domain-containing protein, partial [Acidobacteria bacterium ACD]|nr:DUF1592 domain-containing protein [Acidobacteria bacterium ACD]